MKIFITLMFIGISLTSFAQRPVVFLNHTVPSTYASSTQPTYRSAEGINFLQFIIPQDIICHNLYDFMVMPFPSDPNFYYSVTSFSIYNNGGDLVYKQIGKQLDSLGSDILGLYYHHTSPAPNPSHVTGDYRLCKIKFEQNFELKAGIYYFALYSAASAATIGQNYATQHQITKPIRDLRYLGVMGNMATNMFNRVKDTQKTFFHTVLTAEQLPDKLPSPINIPPTLPPTRNWWSTRDFYYVPILEID